MDGKLLYQDEVMGVVEVGNLIITVFRTPLTMTQLGALRQVLEAKPPSWLASSAGLTVVGSKAISARIPAEAREAMGKLAKDFTSRKTAVVVETEGFLAATGRSIITGLMLLGTRNKFNISGTVNDAALWLEDVTHLSVDDVARAVALGRSATEKVAAG